MFVRGNSHCFWAIAVCVTLALQASAQAPPPPKPGALVGTEKRARDELDAAGRLAADKRYDDAVKRYQQILGESGDMLVTAPDDPNRAIPARWLVHQQIAALPESARKIFRDAVEPSAKKWLDEGAAHRDARLLEQVVAQAFCSKSAMQALQLLGDLAFERGEFEVAEHYWRMLARYPSEIANKAPANPSELLHPDTHGDDALAQAKLILSLLFRGEAQRARAEYELFAKQHPSDRGFFAGKQGKLAETLGAMIAGGSKWHVPGKGPVGAAWTTFAGDATRNSNVASLATPYWPDSPNWWRKLPGDPKAKPHKEADPPLGTGAAARTLAFEPVIVPGYVLVADAARVFAYDLATGKPAAKYDYGEKTGLPESLDLRVPSQTDARYTLTVVGNLIYARFGAQPVQPADPSKPQEMDSAIVCLSMDRNGDKLGLRFRWAIRARPLDSDPPMMFEGAPLVSGGRLYVARTQFDGRQAISTILCYDADGPGGPNEPPALRWKQDVWIVEPPAEPVRHRHDLLTLAGPNVVYCTHSGAIVALDAITGKRAWAYRYPLAESRALDGVQPHDLSPCIAANGRIFAAPVDSNHLLCLDARTGALIWKSQPIHIVQMLGVANGLVFATLGSFPQGIRAYRVSDGGIQWTQPDVGNLAAFGRGFITDQWIIWPTSHGLRVLRQDHGELIHAGSNDEPWGNLAFGEGCLIVATPSEIWGFVPERMRLGQLRMDAKQNPNDALTRYQAALAEADAGNWNQAFAEFRKSEELAAGESIQGMPLQQAARHRRHEILIMQAEQAWKLNLKSEAGAKLREACGEPYALNDRLRAWVFRLHAGDRTFPDIFDNAALVDLWLTRPDGLPLRASDYLLSLLDGGAKQDWENHATATLAKDTTAAIRQFPKSKAVQTELLRRARKAEAKGDLRAAAENYRRLPMTERLGLAAIYDRTGYKDQARIIRHRINPGKFTLADPPIVSHALDVNVPLKPAAAIDLPPNHEWPLGPLRDPATGDDLSPISAEGAAFFFDTNQVVCRSLTNGKALWTRQIDHDARWCVFHADSVIVAGTTGVSRLDRRHGRIAWTFTRPDRGPLPAGFPDAEFRTLNLQIESPPFSSFCLAGSQLYFLWGDELLALDAESGEPLWNLRAPGAPLLSASQGAGLNDKYLATIDHLLVQTRGGECLAVQASTGRILYRQPAPAMWPTAPVLIDSQRAIFPADGDRIKAIELATGHEIWSRQLEGSPSLTGSAPQLRRDGSFVLAVVERNYGYELERWSIDTGASLDHAKFLGVEPVDLAASALAPDAFVLASNRMLFAIDRETGNRAWELPLPKRGHERWFARPARSAVLVFPEFALPNADFNWLRDHAHRELAGLPSLMRFQSATSMLYHGYLERSFPLLAIDRKAGKKMQELNFPVFGPRNALLMGDRLVVISKGKLIRFD